MDVIKSGLKFGSIFSKMFNHPNVLKLSILKAVTDLAGVEWLVVIVWPMEVFVFNSEMLIGITTWMYDMVLVIVLIS